MQYPWRPEESIPQATLHWALGATSLAVIPMSPFLSVHTQQCHLHLSPSAPFLPPSLPPPTALKAALWPGRLQCLCPLTYPILFTVSSDGPNFRDVTGHTCCRCRHPSWGLSCISLIAYSSGCSWPCLYFSNAQSSQPSPRLKEGLGLFQPD